MKSLEFFDPEIYRSIQSELSRQESHIELIASENYVSRFVLEAQGSVLTNKYAEGYPGKRYYGGCEHVDVAEQLAIDRAKSLFSADYANVQAHSGSQANAAVYQSLMSPGDTILGLALDHGGHLTHGAKVNFSGKVYNSVSYGVSENDECLDYDEIYALAQEYKPKVLLGGFSAYSRICDWEKMREIADSVHAYLVVDMAHVAGLIAAGLYPSPVPHAHVVTSTTHKTLGGPRGGLILSNGGEDIYKKINSAVFPGQQGGPLMHVIAAKAISFREAMTSEFKKVQQNTVTNAKAMAEIMSLRGIRVVSGGTDSHMFLLDTKSCGLTGKVAEAILGKTNITVNKNTIPNDSESPFVTSGIRIGTPAISRRGFGVNDAINVAHWVVDLLQRPEDDYLQSKVMGDVADLCYRKPVYGTMA